MGGSDTGTDKGYLFFDKIYGRINTDAFSDVLVRYRYRYKLSFFVFLHEFTGSPITLSVIAKLVMLGSDTSYLIVTVYRGN